MLINAARTSGSYFNSLQRDKRATASRSLFEQSAAQQFSNLIKALAVMRIGVHTQLINATSGRMVDCDFNFLESAST